MTPVVRLSLYGLKLSTEHHCNRHIPTENVYLDNQEVNGDILRTYKISVNRVLEKQEYLSCITLNINIIQSFVLVL